MTSKTLILQQQARRVLTKHSIKTCLIRRSYNTLPAIKTDLEQWSKQGDQVKPSYVRDMIQELQDSKRFSKALEASEWMCEQRIFNIFPEDYASRFHLVETVLGLEEAEKFFKSIPENMRDYTVYDNLLRSYTKYEGTLDKAEPTFEKMRDLGFLSKLSPYNSMIDLYGKAKNKNMVKKLKRELLESNIEIDTLSDTEKLKRQVYRFWDNYKKNSKMEDDTNRSLISSLLKKEDVEGAEMIYYEKWQPLGPIHLDISIPGLLISWYRAKGNESKVEELV